MQTSDSPGRSKRRQLASGLIAVLVLAAGATLWWQRRMEAGVQSARIPSLFWAFDDYVYYYPTAEYAFTELGAGRLPLWNPHQHAGSPFFATAQHGILYPPNLIYVWVITATAEKLNALLHLTFAGFGAALLARAWCLGWPAAAVTGVAFAFAPPVSALVVLPPHLIGVAWMPWLLLVLHRVLASQRPWPWAGLLGVSVALQYLGGYPMYCLISAYFMAAYFCWWQWGSWRSTASRRALVRSGVAVAVATVLALSLSAPQLLPNLELAQRSLRDPTALSLQEAALNSVRPSTSLLRALLPMVDVEQVLPSVYVGIPLLLLAGLGASASWRTTPAGFFVGASVVSWLLACGTNAPLFRLYYLLPGGAAFRVPFRFFPATALAIAVLCGLGTDALWRQQPAMRAGRLRGLALASLGIGVALLLAAWLVPLPERLEPAASQPPSFPSFMMPAERPARLFALLGCALLAMAAWLSAYLRGGLRIRRALVVFLPPIVYALLFFATRNTAPLPATHPNLHTMPESVAAFLRTEQGVARTFVAHSPWPLGPPGRHLPARAGLLHGLYVVGDRENVFSKRFADFAAMIEPGARRELDASADRAGLPALRSQGEVFASAESPNLRLLDLLGTRFIVQGPGTNFHAERAPQRFVPIFNGASVRIFRNLEALPRAFLVHAVEVVADPTRQLARLVAPDFDPRTTALLDGPPPIELLPPAGAPTERAQIVSYAPDEVVVDVDAAAPGILVLSDEHYPGWHSEVDGRPTPILLTDFLFRGVPVGAGTHRVVFRFVPSSLHRALLAAVIGSLLALAALFTLNRWSTSSARRVCPSG